MAEAKNKPTAVPDSKPSRFDELFSTDQELAAGGVVFLIEGDRGSDDEISVTVAHTGGHNFDYNECVGRLSGPYQTLIDQAQLSTEKMRGILIEAFAETIVKDWVGITLGGNVVKFSKENAIAVMTESPSFYDAIQKFARTANNFRASFVEGVVGNSPSSSGGS